MPRESATEERQAEIDEGKMCGGAAQVIDQNGVAAYAKGFRDETNDSVGREVVNEEAAAHEIEGSISEWDLQGIANDGADAIRGNKAGRLTVEERETQLEATGAEARGRFPNTE